MLLLPFTTWNIDEVAADIVQQAAARFTPNDYHLQTKKLVDWIHDDFSWFVNNSVILSAGELISEAEQERSDHIEGFQKASSCLNYWPPSDRLDTLFFWSGTVLFYNRLISDGFTPASPILATEQTPVRQPPTVTEEPQHHYFSELVETDKWEYCLKSLKDHEPAVIDATCRWIGNKGSKAVLTGWIDWLEHKRYIPIMDRGNLIPLLKHQFPGLSISRRTLYERPKADTAERIKHYFLAHIPH